MKKILSLVLSLMLLFSMAAIPAAAEESGTSGFPPFISISVKGSVGIETTELSVDACPDSEGAELV